jgi:hypothetical protein
MRRWPRLRDVRRALSDHVVRRLWQSLVDFGAAHDPHAARYADEARHADDQQNADDERHADDRQYADGERPSRQCPGGPPPAHPERVREDVPLSAVELRIARELWPTHSERQPERRAPDGT